MAEVRAHLWVSGRVQGVFFRESTRREAAARGLRGWVRNLADGRVEAVLQGERAQVDAVVNFFRLGPPHARVDDLELRWEEPVAGEAAFRILR